MGLQTCPTEECWRLYLSGSASRAESDALDAHLSDCPSCQGLLDRLSRPPAELLFTSEPAPAGLPDVPGYTLLREIGAGGMGVVYLAEQHRPRRPAALKMIRGGRLGVAHRQSRFQVEADALAQLQHPHIVQVFEVGTFDGGPYFAMEHLEGGSLAEVKNLPAGPRQAAELVRRLADAIRHAHERGVIHRDLKPANVLFTQDGLPKVCDFGLARLADGPSDLTRDGPLGTPSYMAPEQAAGGTDRITVRTDVYALGAVLYELLAGRPPFDGESPQDVLNRVRTEEPALPRTLRRGVPRDLETVALKCLEKDPGRRYASAADLADDLGRWLNGEPIRARPASAPERAARWARRHPAWATALAFLIVGPSAVAGVAAWDGAQLRQKNDEIARKNGDISRANAELVERRRLAVQAADAMVEKVAQGLEPIAGARAAVIRDVLASAGGVYADLKKGDPSPEVLAGDGRMHVRFAAVYLRMNDSDAAAREADAALDDFRTLLAEAPDDPAHRAGFADALEMRGRAALYRDDAAAASKDFAACRDRRAALLDADPASAGRKAALASARLWLGLSYVPLGRPDDAKAELDEALRLRTELAGEPLSSAAPLRAREVAEAHQRLGELALHQLDAAEAARQFRQARDVLGPLAKANPSDLVVRKRLAEIQLFLGDAVLLLQDPSNPAGLLGGLLGGDDPVALFKEALAAADQGLHDDPDDLEWRLTRMRSRVGLGLADLKGAMIAAELPGPLGDRDGAKQKAAVQLKNLQEMLDLGKELIAKDPHNHVLREEAAGTEAGLALANYVLGRLGEAPAEHFRAAVTLQKASIQHIEALAARDPSNRELAQALEQSRLFLRMDEDQAAAAAPPPPGKENP